MTFSEAQQETLADALIAASYARRALVANVTEATARADIRAKNVLLDVCLEMGMAYAEADELAWAEKVNTDWLLSGTSEADEGEYFASDYPAYCPVEGYL